MTTKVLIIRLSSIGDIILTTPVIRCVKEQWEGEVEIHYLTKRVYAPLLAHHPHVDQLHLVDHSIKEVLPKLEQEQFHYVVDLHHNMRSYQIKKRLKAMAFSFPKLNWEKWVYVNFKKDILPDVHIVDRYLDTVKNFGVKNDDKGLDLYLGDIHVDVSSRLGNASKFIAAGIGASYFTKRLPEEKWIQMLSRVNQPVLLLGGKEDKDVGKRIALKSGQHVVNLAGNLSLLESASVVQQSSAVIVNDTGVMHMAAAFQRPVLSIWGNTTPRLGMTPYRSGEGSRQFEVEGLRCRPCSKLGFQKCPKKHFNCMELQDVLEMADHLNRLVN